VESLIGRLAAAEKRLASLEEGQALQAADALAKSAQTLAGVRVVAAVAQGATGGLLRTLALDVRARLGEGDPVVVALFEAGERPSVVVATNAAARDAGLAAGDLVKTATTALGGGGGGKPDVAQGGGTDSAAIPTAIAAIESVIRERA